MSSDQKSIFALFVAVVGLFLVWLWSTGRARVVWQDLWTGSNQSSFSPANASSGSSGISLPPITIPGVGDIPVTGPGAANVPGAGGSVPPVYTPPGGYDYSVPPVTPSAAYAPIAASPATAPFSFTGFSVPSFTGGLRIGEPNEPIYSGAASTNYGVA